jgi:hypothetical protein
MVYGSIHTVLQYLFCMLGQCWAWRKQRWEKSGLYSVQIYRSGNETVMLTNKQALSLICILFAASNCEFLKDSAKSTGCKVKPFGFLFPYHFLLLNELGQCIVLLTKNWLL